MRIKSVSLSFLSALAFAGTLMVPANVYADDIPLPPANFRAKDGGDRYTFSWAQVGRTGVNGGSVDPSKVTYVLEALKDNYETERQLSSSDSRNYTLFYPTTQGEQDIMRFGLYARNSAGRSAYTYYKVVKGAPYNLPYREKFSNASPRSLVWQDGDGTFAVTSQTSADGDGGCIACVPARDGSPTSLNLGKILLAYSENPRLSFMIYGLDEGETLTVKVVRPDGQEAALKTLAGPVEEWTRISIDLSGVRNQEYVIPKFQIDEGNSGYFYIDDICLEDPYDDDLAVTVRPLDTSANSPSVRLFVENAGINPASGASVALYADNAFFTRLYLDDTLAPGEIRTFDVPLAISGQDPVEIKAQIEWIFDLNPYNDTATTQFLCSGSSQQAAGVDGIYDGIPEYGAVYSVDGRLVSTGATRGLQPGVYIVNGKKYMVR